MPKKRSLLLLTVVAMLLFAGRSFGQFPQIVGVVYDYHKIPSKVLNEDRTVLVHLPHSYAQGVTKYPVIYMLDAHPPQSEMMTGIIEQQVWGNQIPEMIIVGIQNTNRSRDLTPTDDGGGGTVGGGDKFLEFLESEVIPLIEKNYRIQPYRIFAGHSLGGLTVVHSFASRPDLFNAYIAASPVFHYDNFFVVKETEKLLKGNPNLDKIMFLGLGDEDDYKAGWKKFQSVIKDGKPKGLAYEFREFPEENHASVVLRSYYWGLRKIYNGWIPPQTGSVADLERHYRKLSKKYGYEILPPEKMLNQIGYDYLRGKNFREAISVFQKNTGNYPSSANAFDSLGEAYEKSGQMKQAVENYQKALELATRTGNVQLIQIYRTNLERVLKEL